MQAYVASNQCIRFPISECRKYLVEGIFTLIFFPNSNDELCYVIYIPRTFQFYNP